MTLIAQVTLELKETDAGRSCDGNKMADSFILLIFILYRTHFFRGCEVGSHSNVVPTQKVSDFGLSENTALLSLVCCVCDLSGLTGHLKALSTHLLMFTAVLQSHLYLLSLQALVGHLDISCIYRKYA